MANYFIYNHSGSGNHGCEALVRTVEKLFISEQSIPVFSESPQEDVHYGVDEIASILPATTAYSKLSPSFLNAYLALRCKGNYFIMDTLPYRKVIGKLTADQIELSVGGDVYCYEDYQKVILLHKMICGRGCRTVLLGCSLEEELFQDPLFMEDMRRYDYISARESLTYGLLQRAGITNIGFAPDSAFTLEKEDLPLPEGFVSGNTVGINLSPLVVRKEMADGIVLENFVRLIRYILENTDCNVALIPHVAWRDNDDRTVLKQLYDMVDCPERVILIGDHNCMQLKGFISRCRFFIGARTHATIAAYSTLVPTVVLGYSVKSRGIANDLFGIDENYVIPVQTLVCEDTMTVAFRWLMEYEKDIKKHLATIMPGYIERARGVKEDVIRALD